MGYPIVNFSSHSSDFVKIRFENGCLSCKPTEKINPIPTDPSIDHECVRGENFYIESKKKRLFCDGLGVSLRPKKYVLVPTFLGDYGRNTLDLHGPCRNGDARAHHAIINAENHASSLADGQNSSLELRDSDEIEAIWRGMSELHPCFTSTNPLDLSLPIDPAQVYLQTEAFDPLFPVLIPTPMLDFAMYSETGGIPWIFVHIVAIVLVIIETPLHYLASLFTRGLIDAYSFYDYDKASYYRFRLDLNTHSHMQYIANRIVTLLVI